MSTRILSVPATLAAIALVGSACVGLVEQAAGLPSGDAGASAEADGSSASSRAARAPVRTAAGDQDAAIASSANPSEQDAPIASSADAGNAGDATAPRGARLAVALHFVVDTSDMALGWTYGASTTALATVAASFARLASSPSPTPSALGLTMFPARSVRQVIPCATTSDCPASSHCTIDECQDHWLHGCGFDGDPTSSCQVHDCPGRCAGTLAECRENMPANPLVRGFFCVSSFDCGKTVTPPSTALALDEAHSEAMIASTLGAELLGGPTDIRPAYLAALADAETFASAHPVDVPAVVLVLGAPTETLADYCGGRGDLAALAAKQLWLGHHVRTFVVALGTEPPSWNKARTNLDAIAAAGGTDRAQIIPCDGLVCPALDGALAQIRAAKL